MVEKFVHEGKEFEIRSYEDGTKIRVKVFLGDEPVSPEYSADLEFNYDYFTRHQESILENLKGVARGDIERNLFFRIPPKN